MPTVRLLLANRPILHSALALVLALVLAACNPGGGTGPGY